MRQTKTTIYVIRLHPMESLGTAIQRCWYLQKGQLTGDVYPTLIVRPSFAAYSIHSMVDTFRLRQQMTPSLVPSVTYPVAMYYKRASQASPTRSSSRTLCQ